MPTPDAWPIVLVGASLLLAAVNVQAGLLYGVVAGLAAVIVVGWVTARGAAGGLEVKGAAAAGVFQGEAQQVRLTLVNRGRWPCVDLRLRVHGSRGFAPGAGRAPGTRVLPRLDPGEQVSLDVSLPGLPRGVHPLPAVEVVASGPVGLFRARRRLAPAGEIVVYPRVWPLRGSPLLDGARELVEAGSRRARAGVEVYGVREHQASEFLRHIHWRSTARRGRPVGLEFERGGPGPVLLLLDLRPGGDDEALEELIRAAASLAAVAVRDGHRVAVAGSRGDGVVREGGGWWPLLEWLARATPEAGLEAPEVVRRLLPGAPPGESLVVLSRTPGAAAAALGLWGGAGGAVLAGVAAADAGAVRARGVRVAHLRAGAAPAEALQNSEAGGAAWT